MWEIAGVRQRERLFNFPSEREISRNKSHLSFGHTGKKTFLCSDAKKILGFEDQSSISQLPRMIRKTRIVLRPTKRISFTFDTIVNGKAKNKVKNDNREDLPRFRNIDVLGNYNINRNFRVFFKIRNIFNREYAGLNAYETFDDLIYNPQELRTFRLGMSYRID